MHWDASTYDDDRELAIYVWDNYGHLINRYERHVWKAVMVESKAEAAGEKMARLLRKRWGAINDADVVEALRKRAPRVPPQGV
jgi:hypothetical protein